MARKLKVSEKQLAEIKSLWREGRTPNTSIAELYSDQKVTEKNIRDWAKVYKWEKKKPKKDTKIRKTTTRGVKSKIVKEALESKKEVDSGEVTLEIKLAEEVKDKSAMELTDLVDIVLNLVIKGEPRYLIVSFLKRKYNVSGVLFNKLHDFAMEALANTVERNMNARFAFHIESRKRLLRKMEDENDWRGCLLVLTDLGKIEGMYPKEPLINVNHISEEDVVFELEMPDEYRGEHFIDVIEEDNEKR